MKNILLFSRTVKVQLKSKVLMP